MPVFIPRGLALNNIAKQAAERIEIPIIVAKNISDPIPNKTILGMTVMLCNGRTIFVADSNVHDMPNASQLANITQESAEVVREIFGIEPRAALVSYSNFGKP